MLAVTTALRKQKGQYRSRKYSACVRKWYIMRALGRNSGKNQILYINVWMMSKDTATDNVLLSAFPSYM